MKKVIFINRYFYPDQSATSQILSDLLFNISDEINLEVHVITGRHSYERNRLFSKQENIENISVHRVWTSSFGRGNLIGRFFDYITFYISTFIQLLFLVKKHDLVVVKTDPPIISFIAYVVTKIKRGYLINWVQDLFPEVAGALGVISKESLLYRILKKAKDISLHAADKNVVIGEKMAELLISGGVDSKKIEVIHNWNVNVNTKYVPKNENKLIQEWGLNDKFIIGYSGNFGRAHEYTVVKNLIDHYSNNKNIVFLFIGGGKYYDDLKRISVLNSYENVHFKGYQDKSVLNQSLSVPDVHLISLSPELEGLIVPSKFYGLASIGMPMIFIGDEDGQIGVMLRDSDSGIVVSNENFNQLVHSIESLLKGEVDLRVISNNIKKLYQSNYTPEKAYNMWKKILVAYDK